MYLLKLRYGIWPDVISHFFPGFYRTFYKPLRATKEKKHNVVGREKKIWICYIYQKDNEKMNLSFNQQSYFSKRTILIYQEACTCTTGKMWMKSNPCIWCGSKRWGHFILGKTDTIFSVKALDKGKYETI